MKKPCIPSTVMPTARRPLMALAIVSAAALAACGGGGDDEAGSTPTPPVTPTALSVGGVVAVGAALPGATVQASCATGSGSATSNTDGTYTLTISGGALPCVLKATSADGATVLHSVAPVGASDAATANITPLSELLVAQLSGTAPADFFTSASGSASTLTGAVTSAAISTAQTAVVATLSAAGIDTAAVTDIVAGSLTAGSGTGYDGVLDNLGATLSSTGTTLTTLVTTVATSAASAGSSGTSSTDNSGEAAALPASLLLKPAASNCAALRSTNYRLIKFAPSLTTGGADEVTTTEVASLDAATLTFTWSDSTSTTLTANATCRYTSPDGADVTVSPTGVLVIRATMGADDTTTSAPGTPRLVVGLPVQTHALADLAGQWNYIGWQSEAGVFSAASGILDIGAGGAMTRSRCEDQPLATAEADCTATTTGLGSFSLAADGGFVLSGTDANGSWRDRVFAYRDGTGRLLLVAINAAGGAAFVTPYRVLHGLPVGYSQYTWNVTMSRNGQAVDTVLANTHTITATDAATGVFTRTTTAESTGVSHSQTLQLNKARNGFIYRAAATATGSDSSTVTVREMFSLKLAPGLNAYHLPATNGTNARLGLAVGRP